MFSVCGFSLGSSRVLLGWLLLKVLCGIRVVSFVFGIFCVCRLVCILLVFLLCMKVFDCVK